MMHLRVAAVACAVLGAIAQSPTPASEACHGLGVDVEVACTTSDNVKSETPAWLPAGASCPTACGTAWDLLLATCPVGTADWDLDATDWVDLQPGLDSDKSGDPHSIVARVTLKWLELGVSKTLCPFQDGTSDAGTGCGTAQRVAQYSATSPTVLNCGTTCSDTCTELDDAAYAVGSGACCPAPAAAAAECTAIARSYGTGNELDYPGMVAVYAASSACKVFECNVENLAGAFCGQTQHAVFGSLLCGASGTLGFVNGLSGMLAGTAIPADMLSCVQTLGSAEATANVKVRAMCAEHASVQCPPLEGEDDDDDDDEPAPPALAGSDVRTASAEAVAPAVLLSAFILAQL